MEYIPETKTLITSGVESVSCGIVDVQTWRIAKLSMDNPGISIMKCSLPDFIYSGDNAGWIYLWDLKDNSLKFKMKVNMNYNSCIGSLKPYKEHFRISKLFSHDKF
jgi:hypothetical protein